MESLQGDGCEANDDHQQDSLSRQERRLGLRRRERVQEGQLLEGLDDRYD